MRVSIPYDTKLVEADIPVERLRTLRRRGPALPPVDPGPAVAVALDAPIHFPPLRRALTPDDRVTIVVDENLPHLAVMLEPLLDHVETAGVAAESVTLLCPPTRSRQAWIDDLPERFEAVHVEVHDATDRRRLAYLATTKDGRRIYLNRTAVEADQLVIMSGLHYDPLHGYAGPESLIYPALSDRDSRRSWEKALTMAAPAEEPWPARREAEEVLWLLGAPFLVQAIHGPGDSIVQVFAGSIESLTHGRSAQDSMWRSTIDRPADVVVAGVGVSTAGSAHERIARAACAASRVVSDGGTIVLLTPDAIESGDGLSRAQQFDDAAAALKALQKEPPTDLATAYQWLRACMRARLVLHGGWPADIVESLFATPMEDPRQLQRILDAGGDCLMLPDADRAMVTLAEEI